jgi:hypothetical protein
VSGYSKNSEIYDAVKGALDIAFSLEEFDMDRDMKGAFRTNMDTIKSMARQLGISTSSPEEIRIREIWAAEEKKRQEAIRIKKEILRKKEELEWDIKKAKQELKNIPGTLFFATELAEAQEKLRDIKKWKLFRTQSKKEEQIKQQEAIVDKIMKKGEKEKQKEIVAQTNLIANLESKLSDFISANKTILNEK